MTCDRCGKRLHGAPGSSPWHVCRLEHSTHVGEYSVALWDRGKPGATWAVTRSVPPWRDNTWRAACPTYEAALAAARLLAS